VALRSLLALLAGVALALAFEPLTAVWVVPVALAAFFLSVRGLSPRRAWVPGLLFGAGFQFVLLWWMRAVGPDAWIALSLVETAYFGVLGALAAVVGRWRWWPLWSALLWVGIEAWRSSWPFSGMPWGRLGFSIIDTPFAAGLPYVGVSGVSLGLALSGTALAWAVTELSRRRTKVVAVRVVGVVGGLVVIGLLPWLSPYHAQPEGSATVAVVQGNVPGDGSDILLDHRQVTRNHVDATRRLADDIAAGRTPRPDFVVWPENSTAVDPFRDTEVHTGIELASSTIGLPILVGAIADAPDPTGVLNQGIVWDPVTGPGDRYTKRHPVPFGEYIPWRDRVFKGNFGKLAMISRDMFSGTRAEPLTIAGVRVADAICFDVAYDDGLAAQLTHGAELLVVQTSNASFIHTHQIDQQFAITRVRALESQRAVAVAATNGVTGLIDPDGQVIAAATPRTQDVLVGELPLSTVVTPGVRLNPWLGRLGGLVVVAALIGLLPYRRRGNNEETPTHAVESDPALAGATERQ
jgi:apolipoprotein N-acyltransferase